MPKMIHLGLAQPQTATKPLLFMGFTQEKWPSNLKTALLQRQCRKHREDRFTQQQRENYVGIRNEFFDLSEKYSSSGDQSDEAKVRVRIWCINHFRRLKSLEREEHGGDFSSAIALSFPGFERRDRCVTCQATSFFTTLESPLDKLVGKKESLAWDITKDDFKCAELMTSGGYVDFTSEDMQLVSFSNSSSWSLAPPKRRRNNPVEK